MSSDAQGWYYSFLSLAALYTLFDFGLSLVLVQTAAHITVDARWAHKNGLVGVGVTHLQSLILASNRFYRLLAISFVVLVGPAGWHFFQAADQQSMVWQAQWIGLVIATALSLLPLPILAIVEGSGNLTAVAAVRLAQAVIGSVGTWIVLLCGGGLWATVMVPLASFLSSMSWAVLYRRNIFHATNPDNGLFNWRTEIWSFQWRLGLSWLSGYLLTQIQVLVLFSVKDATAAGKLGLSLAIGNMIGLIVQAFIVRHIPAMAQAAARRDWKFMDMLFYRDFVFSCAFFVLIASGTIVILNILTRCGYTVRVLPSASFSALILALFLSNIQGALATQLRSYRKEPLVWITVAGATATLVISIFAAHIWGVMGVVMAMLSVQMVFVLPSSVLAFRHFNSVWRRDYVTHT